MKRPSRGTLFLWVAAGILLLTGATLAGGAETAAIHSASTQISAIGRDLDTPLADRARSLLGLVVLGFIAWLLSNDRKSVLWRVVAWGTALQLLFAVFILRAPVGGIVFDGLNTVVMALIGFTLDGASFIFGNLVWDSVPVGTGPISPGAQGVFQPSAGQQIANTGALIAFNVFPTIIFFSSLMTVLYHLRIMQVAVKGFATVAGGVLAVYVGIAPSRRDDIARIVLRAMIGGTIAAFMTATVVGMLL